MRMMTWQVVAAQICAKSAMMVAEVALVVLAEWGGCCDWMVVVMMVEVVVLSEYGKKWLRMAAGWLMDGDLTWMLTA